jgi:hypothetical protein
MKLLSASNLFSLTTGLLCVGASSALAVGDTNEVWISARTNALGTGTISGSGAITNPYYGDFDAIVRSLPTNTTMHLLPGVHFTKGYSYITNDISLQHGQRLVGAGIDTTTIKRATNFYTTAQTLRGTADEVGVSDLTVDCSGTASNLASGVLLGGNDVSIRRIKVLGSSGNQSQGAESFAIYAGGTSDSGGATRGAVISQSEVSSVAGDYTTAVTLGGQGVIEFTKVIFPAVTNAGQATFQAYQANGTYGASIVGNTSEGGVVGFYTDTYSETNLLILNNMFRNVWDGVFVRKGNGWHVDGLTVGNNLIEISTNLPSSGADPGGIAVDNNDSSGSNYYQNVVIYGNTIRYYNHGVYSGSLSPFAVRTWSTASGADYHNVRVINNTVDRSLAWYLKASGNWDAQNSDLTGVPTHVRQIIAGSAGTITLSATDGSVFVTGTGTTNVTLSSASGFTGSEVIVVNQKTNSLSVTAPIGQQLLPAVAVTLSTNQTARFISDGGTNWMRQF